MPYDVNGPMPAPTVKRRKVGPLTWTAGALLTGALVAGTVLSVVPRGMVNEAAPVTTTAAPEPSATPTPSKKPTATKESSAPEPPSLPALLPYPAMAKAKSTTRALLEAWRSIGAQRF
jgi:hypothetical protein